MTPLNDKLFVEPDKREETTKGGILLPEVAKFRPQVGTIIHENPNYPDLKVGTRVFWPSFAGREIDEPAVGKFYILSYKELWGIL